MTLLLPFAVVNLVTQAYSLAGGALLITATLVLAVLRVQRGHDYEKLVLRFFVPAGTLFLTHVYSIDGIVATVWCYPTIIAFYCILSRARAVAANALLLSVVMPLTFVTIDPALAARFCATLVAVSLFANILVREIDAMRQRLSFQIEHDPLTGLLNRHSLTTRLDAAIERAARSGGPAALLALDLDHFKTINDRFGHETGDRVLCEVARLLLARTDEDDAVFRIGGEEFLVLLGARGRVGSGRRRRGVAIGYRAGGHPAASPGDGERGRGRAPRRRRPRELDAARRRASLRRQARRTQSRGHDAIAARRPDGRGTGTAGRGLSARAARLHMTGG